MGFCMLFYQVGTLADNPQTSLKTCCAAKVTLGKPVPVLPFGWSLTSAGAILDEICVSYGFGSEYFYFLPVILIVEPLSGWIPPSFLELSFLKVGSLMFLID